LFRKFYKYIAAAVLSVVVITQWDTVEQILIESLQDSETTTPIEHHTSDDNSAEQKSRSGEKSPIIKVLSWNFCNLGGSKSYKHIEFAADMLKDYDIVAIQEVATKKMGADAVAHLHSELNRLGSKWDYVLSEPTKGPGTERYAYLWKTNKLKLASKPWLVTAKNLQNDLDREPFMARFDVGDKSVLMANFHAIPTSKKPQNEIALLYKLHDSYRKDNLMIMGDFNLAEDHEAFNSLKDKGYTSALVDQKTSLKRMRDKEGNHLAKEYDNIFFEHGPLSKHKSGFIDFVKYFDSLDDARKVSDHLPIWTEIGWN